uniref:Uncharacterized protein n=1 Tax=Anguilla anguilla TaxID=7936 RepID=A0A0E9WE42_ANGAN
MKRMFFLSTSVTLGLILCFQLLQSLSKSDGFSWNVLLFVFQTDVMFCSQGVLSEWRFHFVRQERVS